MASKIKVDQIQTADGTGTIALQNQLSGMTTASLPALGSAQMPTGSVLQVVQGTDTGYTTTTSDTYADTGLSASITPANGSKVLVLISHGGLDKRNGNGYMGLKLFRGSTEILLFSGQFGYSASTLIQSGGLSYSYLDASAGGNGSTAITYKTQFNSSGGVITAGFGAGGEVSTLTLMEIAG